MKLAFGEYFNLNQVEKSSEFNGLELFCRNNGNKVFIVKVEDNKIIIEVENVVGNA